MQFFPSSHSSFLAQSENHVGRNRFLTVGSAYKPFFACLLLIQVGWTRFILVLGVFLLKFKGWKELGCHWHRSANLSHFSVPGRSVFAAVELRYHCLSFYKEHFTLQSFFLKRGRCGGALFLCFTHKISQKSMWSKDICFLSHTHTLVKWHNLLGRYQEFRNNHKKSNKKQRI